MPSNVVLVTGVGGELGGKLLARLGSNEQLERVIGVDTVPPSQWLVDRMGRAEFVRADIRNPLIERIIADAGVDTVVHASMTAHPAGPEPRVAVKDTNIIGTMRLFAACQRSPRVRKLVVKSTAAVYGAGPRSQAVFTEDSPLKPASSRGYVSDAIDMEGYIRGLRRRRPDLTVTTARFANLMGPAVDTVLTRYFALPVVPTIFGYDARMQFVHSADALAVLEQATMRDIPGTFNVAADGVIMLSQAIRLAGRVELPVPSSALPTVAPILRGAKLVDFSPDQIQLLTYGRVVDTTKLEQEFGYAPRWTTREAFDDYVRGRALGPVVDRESLAALAGKVATSAVSGQTSGRAQPR
ncbi:UDP-glucose 4-epimerase [Haloechinothrix alba]|uniref:UDP-glucose 4-epimerase n=1 Tax=Haloechinothrix alba TaxID=664784 RepID=A0A238W1G0_9PSEU|nr:NAD-dependent epimerase/dehydratase family protein [Haloechinothrix alba]SNR40237.1 UDP-glucose 4-epimerase [Haloechinothrix alba]